MMTDIYIGGSVTGKSETRDYDFLIVKGEQHIGLPQSHIDVLGLKPSVFASLWAASDSEQLDVQKVYMASAHFAGSSIELDVLPAGMPTVGVAVLRTLGFSIDLENGSIEGPATPLTIHRGLSPRSIQIGHNRVYMGSDDGLVYALDAGNLAAEWRSRLLEGRTITHLTVANGRVYAALADGWVYALDAGNLATEWRSRLLEGRTITHLTVAYGRVYVALADGWVYALDAGNLEMEWRNALLEGKTISHLLVADGRVYVALADGWVHAMDARNLEALWQITLPEMRKIAHFAVAGD